MERLYERRHFEDNGVIFAPPEKVFDYADDHSNFSAHMAKSSMMMGGGSMKTEVDEGKGQRIGSHIRMKGKVFGVSLYLDEIITRREPPKLKVWETVGSPKLLVIGSYEMGLEISPYNSDSNLKVFINYELPNSKTRWLGHLFGSIYAKWCVQQMIRGVRNEFNKQQEH